MALSKKDRQYIDNVRKQLDAKNHRESDFNSDETDEDEALANLTSGEEAEEVRNEKNLLEREPVDYSVFDAAVSIADDAALRYDEASLGFDPDAFGVDPLPSEIRRKTESRHHPVDRHGDDADDLFGDPADDVPEPEPEPIARHVIASPSDSRSNDDGDDGGAANGNRAPRMITITDVINELSSIREQSGNVPCLVHTSASDHRIINIDPPDDDGCVRICS